MLSRRQFLLGTAALAITGPVAGTVLTVDDIKRALAMLEANTRDEWLVPIHPSHVWYDARRNRLPNEWTMEFIPIG